MMRKKLNVWSNYLICVLLCVNLLTLFYLPYQYSHSPSVSPSKTTSEVRGVWLTNVASGVFFAPWGVNRAIHQLSRLNFNTLYPVVWNRGYTFYPSQVAKEATGELEDPVLSLMRGSSDVLKEIVKVAHQEEMNVLPWFEYGLIVPANSPLAKRHPQWLSKNRQGKYLLKNHNELTEETKTKNWLSRWFYGLYQRRVSQFVWLNPNHPQVQKFIKNLIMEVVTYYDVDGIQLDDHFGLPVELGYDPLTVKLYQKEHGGKKPPSDPYNAEWMRWRSAKLTAFLADIVKNLRVIKPNIRVSLSPNSHEFSYRNYLQDWKTWVKLDLVDELVLQVYRDDLKGFKAELSQPAVEFSRRKIPVSIGILTGTWTHPVSISKISQEIKLVRDRGFAGVSFFYWESLWGYLTPESPHKRRQAFRRFFAEPPKA